MLSSLQGIESQALDSIQIYLLSTLTYSGDRFPIILMGYFVLNMTLLLEVVKNTGSSVFIYHAISDFYAPVSTGNIMVWRCPSVRL